MASWARMEGLLFIIVSVLYLLLVEPESRVKKAVIFMAPIFGIILFSVFGMGVFGISFHDFRREGGGNWRKTRRADFQISGIANDACRNDLSYQRYNRGAIFTRSKKFNMADSHGDIAHLIKLK
jgi:hypothetical protein